MGRSVPKPGLGSMEAYMRTVLIVPEIFDLSRFARIVIWQGLNLVKTPYHDEEIEDEQHGGNATVHN